MKLFQNLTFVLISLIVITSCTNRAFDTYRIEVDNRYGLIDSTGRVVVEPQYLYATPYNSSGTAVVVLDTIIRKGCVKTIYNLEYQENDTLFIKYGYLGQNNKFIFSEPSICWSIILSSDNVDDLMIQTVRKHVFSEGLAAVGDTTTMKYGYINIKGDTMIKPMYADAKAFSEGLAVKSYKENKGALKHGYIDKKGNEVGDFVFLKLESQCRGRAMGVIAEIGSDETDSNDDNVSLKVGDEGEGVTFSNCIVNANGQIVDTRHLLLWLYGNFTYDSIAVAYPSMIGLHLGVGSHFVKHDGSQLQELEYISENKAESIVDDNPKCLGVWGGGDFLDAVRFTDGYAGVKLGEDAWAFVDKNLLVWSSQEELYEDIEPFSCGLAAVKIKGQWGYIDTNFNIVIPCQYDSCFQAGKNLMLVINSSYPRIVSYINRAGETVWQNTKLKDDWSRSIYDVSSGGHWREVQYKHSLTPRNRYFLGVIVLSIAAVIPLMVLVIKCLRKHRKNRGKIKYRHYYDA